MTTDDMAALIAETTPEQMQEFCVINDASLSLMDAVNIRATPENHGNLMQAISSIRRAKGGEELSAAICDLLEMYDRLSR